MGPVDVRAPLIEPRLMGQPAYSLYLCLMAGPVLLLLCKDSNDLEQRSTI